ncbi:MAG: Rpn family recombination-promoting nuclease/putative transposase, partial [Defluviitaleaceae bacterium]|nr:Rpn family recombination-promoting nuclease/putative transposase [Defluviitaleaceae bacterium]
IKSDDEEVLNMLAQRNPQMSKAVGVLKELSADERTRMLYEQREIARRDMVSRTEGAVKDSKLRIARNALRRNMSIEDIVDITGLTYEEVENLRINI